MKFFKVVFFCCLFMSTNAIYAQEPAKQMPDFKFITTWGLDFSRADLNPKNKTLIVFFDATCPHCQKAAAFFNTHLKDLKPYNVLFVTMDENKSIQLFMKNYAPLIPNDENVKILRDTAYYFVPNFLPKHYPAIYVYNKAQALEFYTSDEKDLEKALIALKAK